MKIPSGWYYNDSSSQALHHDGSKIAARGTHVSGSFFKSIQLSFPNSTAIVLSTSDSAYSL